MQTLLQKTTLLALPLAGLLFGGCTAHERFHHDLAELHKNSTRTPIPGLSTNSSMKICRGSMMRPTRAAIMAIAPIGVATTTGTRGQKTAGLCLEHHWLTAVNV